MDMMIAILRHFIPMYMLYLQGKKSLNKPNKVATKTPLNKAIRYVGKIMINTLRLSPPSAAWALFHLPLITGLLGLAGWQ